MRVVRVCLSWVFFFEATAVLAVIFVFPSQYVSVGTFGGPAPDGVVVIYYGLVAGSAVVLGGAWWAVWTGRHSAKWWALAASALDLVLGVTGYQCGIFVSAVLVSTGVIGIPIFLLTSGTVPARVTRPRPTRNPGDGTSEMTDTLVPIAETILTVAAVLTWTKWTAAKGISLGIKDPPAMLGMILVALNLAFAVRECAKAQAVLGLGMKLFVLRFGPFHWERRDGKWRFEFNPLRIFGLGGTTHFAPTDPKYSRDRAICFAISGVAANLIAGAIAITVASVAPGNSAVQAGGFLFIFGCSSVLIGLIAFLPYQRWEGYTAVAMVYQLVSGGPCALMDRASYGTALTLATPLRPRDYDIDLLMRAAERIEQGFWGVYLRLWAAYCYLDNGRPSESGEAFRTAEAIYESVAKSSSADFDSNFVFGSAYLLRDGAGARKWWLVLEARKPTNLNVDYWRARSAANWMEGNFADAKEALTKSDAEAEKLPKAGAYEFDRHLNGLLHEAIEGAAAG
jgi:hypothetical protein